MGALMVRFVIDQKWITEDGARHAEVVEISEEGVSGSVEISGDNGDRETFHGTAEAFQRLEPWRVVAS